jgi:hypothetical protein
MAVTAKPYLASYSRQRTMMPKSLQDWQGFQRFFVSFFMKILTPQEWQAWQ